MAVLQPVRAKIKTKEKKNKNGKFVQVGSG